MTPSQAPPLRLRGRDSQSTGGPAYQGDVNEVNDPVFSDPDCDSLETTPDRAVLSPPYDEVRIAELQVFGPVSSTTTSATTDCVRTKKRACTKLR